jgi:hypothetical protein
MQSGSAGPTQGQALRPDIFFPPGRLTHTLLRLPGAEIMLRMAS